MKNLIATMVDDIIINDIEILNEWYLSSAYIAHGNKWKYVIRKCKEFVPGYEYPWDIYRSYLISHEMFLNSYIINNVRSYGIITYEDEPYHVQEFVPGKIKQLSDYTWEDILSVAEKIALIHQISYTWENSQLIYRRSLREVVTNYETILSLYEQSVWQNNIHILSLVKKAFDIYINLMEWNISRPCVALHGDFWHNNIIFNNDSMPYFIDFSRIPYWEAWIDVGHFLVNLQIEYILTKDHKYIDYYNSFLEKYKKITGDNDIENYIQLNKCFVIGVSLSPKVQWFLKRNDQIIKEVLNIL